MLIFDFNRDIKPALTVTIFDEKYSQTCHGQDFSDCFYDIINLLCFVMKLAGMICKLDRFLENWQIVQCEFAGQSTNWQIGQNIYMYAYNTRILLSTLPI